MNIEVDKIIEHAIADGLREGIKKRLVDSYDSPLNKILAAAIESKREQFQSLLTGALASCIGDSGFREEMNAGIRERLAKLLVQRFGGELERQVNLLKSDPVTRGRITAAIEDIVKAAAPA